MTHAIREIEKDVGEANKTRLDHFNPWQFASTDALTKSYLSVLGRMIAESVGEDIFKKKKNIIKKIVGSGKDIIGHATAVGAVAASGGAALPFMGAIQGGVSGVLGLSDEIVGADELEKLAVRVRSALEKLDHRVILVLDDLDRVNADELVEVLTLVKTFGDLPNVVHVLIYDREILEAVLAQRAGARQSPSFLQKIVQAEFDLPPPTQSGLLALANELISPLFNGTEETEVYTSVWRAAFRNFLKSPRDIVKFYNALSVTWPSVSHEAYAPDMIAIELLRLFDRPLHKVILDNRGVILGTEIDYGGARIEELCEEIKAGRSDSLIRMVSGMFPRLEKHLLSSEASRPLSISQGRPIGSEAGFDTYFRMSPASSTISVSFVEEMTKNLDNSKFIEDSFRLAGKSTTHGYLKSFLEEFLNVIEDTKEVKFSTVEGFARGAGVVLKGSEGFNRTFSVFGNSQRMSLACTKLLSRIEEPDLIGKLQTLFSDETTELEVCVFLIAKIGEKESLIYSESSYSLDLNVTEPDLQALTVTLGKRAVKKFVNGELFESRALWMLLRLIQKSNLLHDLRKMVIEFSQQPEIAMRIAFSAMNIESQGSMGLEMRMDRMPSEEIYDLPKLVDQIKSHLIHADFDSFERHNLSNFVSDSEVLLSGGTPERF